MSSTTPHIYKIACQHCERITQVPSSTVEAIRADERAKRPAVSREAVEWLRNVASNREGNGWPSSDDVYLAELLAALEDK